MDHYSCMIVELSLLTCIISSLIMCLSSATKTVHNPKETNLTISTLESIIHAEFEDLKNIGADDNPYDIFSKIYPRIRDMNNDQITELVDLIDNYNKKWITIE